MWRTKLIDLAKIACNIPAAYQVTYKAFDNTKYVKLEFVNHADAKNFIENSATNPVVVHIGSSPHELKVQWDKDPDTRARGFLLSLLWQAMEKECPLRGPGKDWLRASSIRGELSAINDDSGQSYSLFKIPRDSDKPVAEVDSFIALKIDPAKAAAMIAEAMAQRRAM